MNDRGDHDAPIYVAGHTGMVGSALVRRLRRGGYGNLLLASRTELDLTNQSEVRRYFQEHRPGRVFLAAAKVGGIYANVSSPAQFIRDNLAIECNVIHEAWQAGVQWLMFLGSSCIYPRDCQQPIVESSLLTGSLEPTNEAYAVAKIAGIKLCESYNRQYGTHYVTTMPTNLYGPGDRYDLETSHVLPALIRKMHEARVQGAHSVQVWGSGDPLREFLYVDDLADACVFLMERHQCEGMFNVGSGVEVSIRNLAAMVSRIVGFEGRLQFDRSRPDGTPRKLLDSSRLEALGWMPATGLEQGITLAYRDFLERFA